MKAIRYGDNLQVLRDSIATESVDPIYLDPPVTSNATYNVGLLGSSEWRRAMARSAGCSQQQTKLSPVKLLNSANFVARHTLLAKWGLDDAVPGFRNP